MLVLAVVVCGVFMVNVEVYVVGCRVVVVLVKAVRRLADVAGVGDLQCVLLVMLAHVAAFMSRGQMQPSLNVSFSCVAWILTL